MVRKTEKVLCRQDPSQPAAPWLGPAGNSIWARAALEAVRGLSKPGEARSHIQKYRAPSVREGLG